MPFLFDALLRTHEVPAHAHLELTAIQPSSENTGGFHPGGSIGQFLVPSCSQRHPFDAQIDWVHDRLHLLLLCEQPIDEQLP